MEWNYLKIEANKSHDTAHLPSRLMHVVRVHITHYSTCAVGVLHLAVTVLHVVSKTAGVLVLVHFLLLSYYF